MVSLATIPAPSGFALPWVPETFQARFPRPTPKIPAAREKTQPVPESPISANSDRIKILFHFLYLPSYVLLKVTFLCYHYCISECRLNSIRARSIRPKFRPVRPKKEDHLKRWTRFFETFPVGPNRSVEFWTEISGKFG